jgi:ABC-2 type transport system permease protein
MTGTGSAIYDLGYQRYQGAKFGRGHAFWTLTWFSLRAAFGLGRGEQARRVPVVVGALVFLPALVQVGVASATSMMNFISYGNYLEFTGYAIALFVASQAPELIVTDKNNGALTLYLSRPIKATDYAWAKFAALWFATMTMTLGPQLVLFTARVFLPASPWEAFKEEYFKLLPILGGALLVSVFFAAVALALSSFAVKRAFGSAAVIAFFLMMPALSGIVQVIATGDIKRWSVMLNPTLVVSGFSKWLFELEASRRSIVGRADIPGQAYMWVIIVVSALALFVLMSRYRRNEA